MAQSSVDLVSFIVGRSRIGLPMVAHRFGSKGRGRLLLIGGVHGDEPEGVVAANGLLASFAESFEFALDVVVIPVFNPEGVIYGQRQNSAGVDLNRNMPTRDWSPEIKGPRYQPGPAPASEPESKALVKFLDEWKPSFVVSLHSWKPMLNTNGDCGEFAKIVAEKTGYTMANDIGYPTPGSLGTYAGLERGMPTLTYEIERGLKLDQVVAIHVPAILSAMKALEA
ncbi:MAG: M14 family zinc carboxypeptidase [Bdellovibrionota bacterium]